MPVPRRIHPRDRQRKDCVVPAVVWRGPGSDQFISYGVDIPPTLKQSRRSAARHNHADMERKPPLAVVKRGENVDRKSARLRILIADDDRDTTTTLAALLRDEGHEIHTALRGDEVLELCRFLRPDVVISDVDMPGMSGYAIARELRERHGTLAPLLIAVSGKWTQTSDRLLGEAVGFDHYLLKPTDPRELLAILGQFVIRTANDKQKSND
jgi:CheY-like chemotaxis protein